MTKIKAITITTIVTLIVAFIGFYLFLPAINIKSVGFWIFTIVVLVFGSLLMMVIYAVEDIEQGKAINIITKMLLTIIVIFIIGLAVSATAFRAKSYSKLMSGYITEHDFEDYKPTIGSVPLLDKDSAMNIANRKLGGLQDVISQYEINDTEQITVKGEPTRVACLNHAGFFKWLSNKKSGTPGFVQVNMYTQEAELVRVEGGMKYTKSDFFNRNLHRYLRMKYPTKMFAEVTLELNEEEHPYWVTATLDKKIGLFGGKEVTGAILVDAVTGEHVIYSLDEIPEWIDNIYESSLLLDQYDKYGMYEKGFLNSVVGQKGVKKSTEGYNYIPQGNDNWIYTGVTSVGKDESNIGFVLINKRTKETQYYGIPGAEEFSAMESAEGAVQHLGYTSTFPLLLKIENQPTYLVSLKDSGGLVKMYGMVNVSKYQLVATGNSIQSTLTEYKKLLKDSGADVSNSEVKDLSGEIEDIKIATIEGNSNYFIKLKGESIYYIFDIIDDNRVALLSVGDYIKLEILESSDDIIPARLR